MAIVKKSINVIALIILAAFLFNPSVARGQFFYMENEDIGKPVKDFTLKVVKGEEISLQEYRDGKKAIIFFWATWCPHCRAQLGNLNRDQEEIENSNIKIVLVDVGESEAIVSKYLEKNEINMNVFLDEKSEVSDTYGLIGLPTFYYVGEDGVVIDVQHSLPDDLTEVFQKS